MASSLAYVQFVCDQMCGAGQIRYRKMFGEYAIYCDDKCFGLVCDDQVFINPTEPGKAMVPDAVMAVPYEGAKPRILLEELDCREFLTRFVRTTCDALPPPKPKKPRKQPR